MTAARKHDPEASRAAILAAAEHLFLEKGFAGTSMSEIAKASEVTKSLIHHHFGSKDALWGEIKRRRFSEYYEQQMALFSAPGVNIELLKRSMETFFRFMRDNPQVVRMISWLQLEQDRECLEMMNHLREVGIERITVAQRVGLLRADVPAPFILMTFLGLVKTWFSDPDRESPTDNYGDGVTDAYLDSAWKIFSAGVLHG